jgi:hypothetical protein
LSFNNGTIALQAQNVTVREIVTEWERRGGCQFVHAEQLPATPVTLELPAGTPEFQALDSLFRGLGSSGSGYGYIVAPAKDRPADKSTCGAVYILASSRPAATNTFGTAPVAPMAPPVVRPVLPDDEIPPVTPFPPVQPPQAQGQARPGAVNQPNQPNNGAPNSAAPAGPTFGPVVPSAPGAGPVGPQPTTPTPPPPQPPANQPNLPGVNGGPGRLP